MGGEEHRFGGGWTEEKLRCLADYMAAWNKVLEGKPSFRPFTRIYIDAFSGTGERHEERRDIGPVLTGLELESLKPAKGFFDGSARLAANCLPAFDKLFLIEQDTKRFAKLKELEAEFGSRVRTINGEANATVRKLLAEIDWRNTRAVMFLDPYGCQVEWETLRAIAATRAIDLWYLFPTGMGVLRQLPHDIARQAPAWAASLTKVFGTEDWKDRFYRPDPTIPLLGLTVGPVREASAEVIEEFLIERLRTEFTVVSPKCLRLENSRRNPMFSLCFAAGNPGVGSDIAVRIANNLIAKASKKRR